jgi:uncharacterized protein (TIGR00255 family)
MIKSMTGYGKNETIAESFKVTVEIRTLNSKQLDTNLRIPQILKEKEIEIRKAIGTVLQRGKIDTFVSIEQNTTESAPELNIEMAKHYYAELKSLANAIDQDHNNDYLSIIVKMPDVFVTKTSKINDKDIKLIMECLTGALVAVDKFRTYEGADLEIDIKSRVKIILDLLTQVDKFESKRIATIKDRIRNNISKFELDPSSDSNRLEQEMIYYIEKLDVTEEKVRLKNNCNYFLENLDNTESSGKKLGFITQEIGREINTLGSKANDSDLQKIVVLMKDELEKIKEQLFNIL